MRRAVVARAQMALAFETTYGTPPAGGFVRIPFASATLGADQPLLSNELLGYGRGRIRFLAEGRLRVADHHGHRALHPRFSLGRLDAAVAVD